jgi:CRISPR/Cas system-associated exonuclease Cas4 (RecB family)
MIHLNPSWVVFNEEEHTYTLNGKQLHGITGMLSRQLFADKYKDIPEYILKRAAERGTEIHKDCEFTDATGLEPQTTEGKNYLELRKDFNVIANEYTVSDNEYFASNIDCVWEKDGEVILADIKTTAHLDKEYLSWQLSIYAYLFELQNPELKVSGLYGVWLKDDKKQLVTINRRPTEEIIKLMECEKNGEMYLAPVKDEKQLITRSAVDILIEAKEMADYYKKRYEDIQEQLLAAMKEHGVKSWDTEELKATYSPASESTTFDTKKFQEEHPELYKEYLKKSTRKESLRITIR